MKNNRRYVHGGRRYAAPGRQRLGEGSSPPPMSGTEIPTFTRLAMAEGARRAEFQIGHGLTPRGSPSAVCTRHAPERERLRAHDRHMAERVVQVG